MNHWVCPKCAKSLKTALTLSQPPMCHHPRGSRLVEMVAVDKDPTRVTTTGRGTTGGGDKTKPVGDAT